MIIKGHKIVYNKKIPPAIVDYLRRRMTSLAIHLKHRLGKNYNVQLNFSKKSEAGYLFISPVFELIESMNEYDDLLISIRNHTPKRRQYDLALFMCDFDTWSDLQRFIYGCIPLIKQFDKNGLKERFSESISA